MSDETPAGEATDTLAVLFSRDPLSLSTQDLDAIIARFRAARAQFNLTGEGARRVTKAKAPKRVKSDTKGDATALNEILSEE